MRRNVTLKNVEFVFPDRAARVRVERHHALLQGVAPSRRVLTVNAMPHNDRRRAAAVRRLPQHVLTGDAPSIDQAGFARGPIPQRSADLRPISTGDFAWTLSNDR